MEATQERVSVFRNALENMDSAIEMFQNILSEQQSDAITALLEDGRDLRDEMELLHGNLQELENMLSGYIHDMTALVMPKSWDSMMLVDRNDIWVNMKQIKSNVSDTEQVIWGGALQHYKDVHIHIPKPHISSSMTESEKRSAREEYDRKVRERAQREENYKKLKAFTETQAKQAKQELEECYEEIEKLYRNRIVVYENTDDMDKMALSKEWGNRNVVKVARVKKGTEVTHAIGTAKAQTKISDPRPGNGKQILFSKFDSNWITEVRNIKE